MRKFCVLAFALLLALAFSAPAQTFYIGGGPSIQSDLPHGALNATVGIATGQNTMLLVNYSAHGTVDDIKKGLPLTYKSTAGVRQVMATAAVGRSSLDFFLLGDVGAAIAATATGFVGAAGGGLTFHPGASGLSFSGALQAEYSPVNSGSGGRKNLFIQVGYTFRGK